MLVMHTLELLVAVWMLCLGRVTGGALKTKHQADEESLQAQWFTSQDLTKLSLRAPDFLPLVELGRKWYADKERHRGLPPAVGHVSSLSRLILVHDSGSQLTTLIRVKGQKSLTSFPVSSLTQHAMAAAIKVITMLLIVLIM